MYTNFWGTVNGVSASKYELGNPDGLRIVVSDFGAALLSCIVPDGCGRQVDLVLACSTPEQLIESGTYFGTTVGRYGNRIKRGRFSLEGKTYALESNEGKNHLHGGRIGFDKRLWAVSRRDHGTISFGLVSPDGEEGFPGTLVAQATYRLDGNSLSYELLATVDRPCPVNLLNHSYWNLAGKGDILDHSFQFRADYYTPADDELMLTGEIASVEGTPFDFRIPRTARERYSEIDNQGAGRLSGAPGGYDHNLVLAGQPGEMRQVARIFEPKSGRAVTVATTEPGLHFYTGGYLGGVPNREGGSYPPYAGFTLETQKFPDSPNLGHFPSSILKPGELYRHATELTFEY
ncbi:aldose epimerase family protein [Mesorhizobium sp. M3A.F.Ca.ET.201.01.1.1]|uniref:aldose epimerase family protein n=1 Tax=Mesorhizobium sp. M3A.F.Ca.ET.201.01.1.1 TaxID=2563946 RepID=UPI001678E829|nr:aldose epimerase family protein [Mesorhizobium sp. M3A.F.Ca.ET.201.01.1.1]